MLRTTVRIAFLIVSILALPSFAAADAQIARGEYLVTIGGCNDCHTPGYFFGKPDMERFLGGSDVGFEIPGQGVFLGRNITPDKDTGIGNWTAEQINRIPVRHKTGWPRPRADHALACFRTSQQG